MPLSWPRRRIHIKSLNARGVSAGVPTPRFPNLSLYMDIEIIKVFIDRFENQAQSYNFDDRAKILHFHKLFDDKSAEVLSRLERFIKLYERLKDVHLLVYG